MARYSHLPIYRDSYQLMFLCMQYVKNFDREYKFSLGSRIKDEVINIGIYVVYANSSYDNKAYYINYIISYVETVKILIRLSQDLRILPKEQYLELIKLLNSIGKQANGWIKKN